MPSNQQAAFIDDGYTLTVTIEATPYYPEVEITYRPPTSREFRHDVGKIADHNKNNDIDKSEEFAAEKMAERVKEWSLTDREGNSVPITKENMLRLERHLSGTMFRTVYHYNDLPETAEKN